ncbi:TetR/AcrR family transcriptional regulator [Leucobacter tenebrionis]|uniref:TetR/AcrR family transcriptional regulator n=1 Tax=Leucobacter tenebrionis TaxID=2873270 RepID=UPI001CA621EB|nr:TetR/AcrR family transcriptional regulator [Leucobacter tenebrionis]QZY51540.1 TetR/AcrR family transcriptional regulator [Leucobacter tenebrionis]
MSSPTRGRPPASSREVLADAACELFLEQGYEATSIAEIARRAGVSRSSFFNYFAGKSEILWFVFDGRIAALVDALADPARSLSDALAAFALGEAPDTLALAIVDARTMDVEQELEAGRAARQLRIGAAVTARLERDGVEAVRAEVIGAGYAAALVSAVWRWADLGAGRHRLDRVLGDALAVAREVLG